MAISSPTILYVEDEDDDVLLMQMAFEKEGMGASLRVVSDGQAAIDYLSGTGQYARRDQHPLPTAILLDLNLPILSGFDVLQWIRSQEEFKTLPVIIFSSSDREEDQRNARALGASDYLQKPTSGSLFRKAPQMFKDVRA